MPIVDIEMVGETDPGRDPRLTRELADRLGDVFGSAPGRTWVRLRGFPRSGYAENGVSAPPDPLPVFVTVLHARPPEGDARVQEVRGVTAVVAAVVGRPESRVHVQYAPPGAGRQAFGGELVP